ncbi:unnamed protein product [Linum trigynum]|uniref:Uncharacterized protein n=1 Tax=Linum trigynum TaxID=586398 RepID=A0AAV2DG17_9ROSI
MRRDINREKGKSGAGIWVETRGRGATTRGGAGIGNDERWGVSARQTNVRALLAASLGGRKKGRDAM